MAPRGRRRGSPRASAEDDDESGDSETDETESDVSGSEDEGDGGDGREGNARPSHKKKATTTGGKDVRDTESDLYLIHISEPTRPERISYAVSCLKQKTHETNEDIL